MSSRTKKIIIVISIAALMGTVCIGLFFIRTQSFSSSSPQKKDVPIVKTLGDFRSVTGTNYLIASVTGSDTNANILDELFSSGRWFNSGYGNSQYNLVFLDIATEAVYPLLDTNDYEIVSMESFPRPVYSLNEYGPPEQKEPISWWLFSIVKSDTNQDKDLSSADKQTLSITDVGGRGYTEIISAVDNLLGTAFKNNDTLLIIYCSNGKNYIAHVDLPSRHVTSTEELPLGEEIK